MSWRSRATTMSPTLKLQWRNSFRFSYSPRETKKSSRMPANKDVKNQSQSYLSSLNQLLVLAVLGRKKGCRSEQHNISSEQKRVRLWYD